jgi:hypothetical protein
MFIYDISKYAGSVMARLATGLVVLAALFAAGCEMPVPFEFSNPGDPAATNYQGYYTVDNVAGFDLVSPADGAAVADPLAGRMTVVVAKLAGATAYQVQLATDRDFTSVVATVDATGNQLSIPISDATRGALWVRGRVKDSAGTWSGWTQSRAITVAATVPTLTALASGSSKLVVSWGEFSGATAYTLWYGTSADLGTATQFGGDLNGTTATITGLTAGTNYWVWLRAKNASGTSGPSVPLSAIPLDIPASLELTLSAGDQVLHASWPAIAGATAYEVWYGTSADLGTATKFGDDLTSPAADLTGLSNGTSYWVWVKAKNANGEVMGTAVTVAPYTTGLAINNQVPAMTVSIAGPATVIYYQTPTWTATAKPATSNCSWYLDGQLVAQGSASCTLKGTALPLGSHRLAVRAQAGQAMASAELTVVFKKVPAVGETGPAGGIVFYDAGSQQSWGRYMECAPADLNGGSGIVWWNGSYIGISGAQQFGIGTGKANTAAIIAAQGAGSYAASLCQSYSLNGYSDWFLPSNDELNLMYTNLKVSGIGGFAASTYWSSSQWDISSAARFQNFDNGYQSFTNPNGPFLVRAVRAF